MVSDNQETKDAEKTRELMNPKGSYECGFCEVSFPTAEALYAHQQKEHDPDGIMFSEIGFPK